MNITEENKVYTVAIIANLDSSCAPWISAFSSREKRDAFIDAVKQRIIKAGKEDEFAVFGDSGAMDDTDYLDYLPAPVPVASDAPWVLTDDETIQYVRRLGPETYDVLQISLLDPGTMVYGVYRDTVHIPDYTYNEILMILKTFGYSSFAEVSSAYGEEMYSQIIAECIFEHYCDATDAPIFEGAKDEAVAFIKQYVKGEAREEKP